MFPKVVLASFALVAAFLCGLSAEAQQAKDKKEKRKGSILGKLVSAKPTPNGKNVIAEVLAPGEEKPRSYRVNYDPLTKGPIAKVLAAVKTAKEGDTVQFDWIDTGEGLAMTTFKIVKKAPAEEKKKDETK